jgi:hypothetical protein
LGEDLREVRRIAYLKKFDVYCGVRENNPHQLLGPLSSFMGAILNIQSLCSGQEKDNIRMEVAAEGKGRTFSLPSLRNWVAKSNGGDEDFHIYSSG